MKKPQKSKWPDFFLTLAIGLFLGALFGLVAGFFVGALVMFGGNRRPISHTPSPALQLINRWGEPKTNLAIAIWFVVWAVVGGVVAAYQIPEWEYPWYKGLTETILKRDPCSEEATSPTDPSDNKNGEAKDPAAENPDV